MKIEPHIETKTRTTRRHSIKLDRERLFQLLTESGLIPTGLPKETQFSFNVEVPGDSSLEIAGVTPLNVSWTTVEETEEEEGTI